jgi:hypothetical protein
MSFYTLEGKEVVADKVHRNYSAEDVLMKKGAKLNPARQKRQ